MDSPSPEPSAGGAPIVGPIVGPRPGIAARIEDWFHVRRERLSTRAGRIPTVVPFSGYGGAGWIRVLGRVLYLRPPEARQRRTSQTAAVQGVRGWRSFTSLHVPYAPVTIEVGSTSRSVRADRGGVIDTRVEIELQPGWHTVSLRIGGTAGTGGAITEAQVFVADPDARFGVVSDVDDTVMVTALPRPLLAAWNSFVVNEHARIATPGMAVFLDRQVQAHPGGPMIYLSTGAWNVAPALTRFLTRNLYPAGALLLTDWGPTPDRWFRDGVAHKKTQLRRLAQEFPDIRWLLVGDDGQHDEEIYGEFCLEHPDNVAAVAIRQLTPSEAVLAGARRHPHDRRDPRIPWVYGTDGAMLAEQLAEHGLGV